MLVLPVTHCPHCKQKVSTWQQFLLIAGTRLLVAFGIGALTWTLGAGIGMATDDVQQVALGFGAVGFAVGLYWSRQLAHWMDDPPCPHCKRMIPLERTRW